MKTLISLTILLVAAASYADPSLLEIARNPRHPEHASRQKLQKAQDYLGKLYAQAPSTDEYEDRLDLLVWLTKSPPAEEMGLSGLLVRILSVEEHAEVRKAALSAMGEIGIRQLVETIVVENISPPPGFRFLKTTAVREEAARSLGKLQRRFPNPLTLSSTLLTLDKAAKDKTLLTGAIDGIALCGMEHPEVRELLSRILTHSGTEYTELAQIRVVQWYRYAKLEHAGMVQELRQLAVQSKYPTVRLSAIHTLLVLEKSDHTTMASLDSLANSPKGQSARAHTYAKQLLKDFRKAEGLSAGDAIENICAFVNARAN